VEIFSATRLPSNTTYSAGDFWLILQMARKSNSVEMVDEHEVAVFFDLRKENPAAIR
jgi:hypothetical protein